MIFILLVASSFAQTPSWVEGVRSGEESLKLSQGERTFYRRVMKDGEDCVKTKGLAESDLKQDAGINGEVSYTLDYSHFDEKREECAVTISITREQIKREKRLEEMLKKNEELIKANQEMSQFIHKNRDLLDKENKRHQRAAYEGASLSRESDRVRRYLRAGISDRKLGRLIGERPDVHYANDDECYWHYKTFYRSIHGNLKICWAKGRRENFALGYCEINTKKCFNLN